MKHCVSFFVLLVVLSACKPTVPSEYIQPGELEDILYDYHVSQAMAKTEKVLQDYDKSYFFEAVLHKYGYTEAQFDTSLVYYYSHVDKLKEIYGRVNERLIEEAKNLGASVGSIRQYSQYGTTGDTANIWKLDTELLLIPCVTQNRYDFTIPVDTSFYEGDAFMLQFMSEFLWQNGMKDGVVCMVRKYEGDSIIQNFTHVSMSGTAQLRVPAVNDKKLKEMRGFIYLNDGNDANDIRRMMFISQIQLIRFHAKNTEQHETTDSSPNQADSQQRTANTRASLSDTLRRRVMPGSGGKVLSSQERTVTHGVAAGRHHLRKDPKRVGGNSSR